MGYLQRIFHDTDDLNRQAILESSPRRPGATLLDLGCGDGAFTLRVGTQVGAARLVGVEFIDALADAAAQKGIEVARVNLASPLPFEDASFDVIHSNQVIEHIAGTDLFMREIQRLLRPGGYAVVSTNNLSSLHNIFSLLLGWQPMTNHVSDEMVGLGNPVNPFRGQQAGPGDMHLRIFTGRGLADLARYHGLRVDLQRTVGFYPLPPRAARFATWLLPVWGAYLVQRYVL
jgi:SAM-dependent methyltransferase